jgi:hypothetical protein
MWRNSSCMSDWLETMRGKVAVVIVGSFSSGSREESTGPVSLG